MQKKIKMLSAIEENYIKSIYKLLEAGHRPVSTNSLAEKMDIKAASATDMLKRLNEKLLIHYQKYQGVTLTEKGTHIALQIIRKHRLWEMFLVEKLNFTWDEVHDVAEQLEHIHSEKLIQELDRFLEYPRFDPHGEPIPSASLEMQYDQRTTLVNFKKGDHLRVTGVKDDSPLYLTYLDSIGIDLDTKIEILQLNEYDNTILISTNGRPANLISIQVAKNLIVKMD